MNRGLRGAAVVLALASLCVLAGCGSSSNPAPPPIPVNPPPPSAALSAGGAAVAGVDFGLVDCGGTAPDDKSITLTNAGGQSLEWTATLDSADEFWIDGAASGQVDPNGGTATLKIAAKAVPSSSKANATTNATLTITTNDANNPKFTLPVGITSQGATLSLKPSIADFGVVPVGMAAPGIAITVQNSGNKSATVTFSSPTSKDFTVNPANGSVDPGKSLVVNAGYKPTTLSGTPTETATTMSVTGALCGVPPSTLVALRGQGTTGALAYSPGTLDYGMTPCGSTGAPEQLTIANLGNQPYSFSLALGQGTQSPFTIDVSSGTLQPNQTATVTVTPLPLPFPAQTGQNGYGDQLTLTTNVPNDQPHTIQLVQTAQGAILTFTLPSGTVNFGAVLIGQTATQTVAVQNSGNLDSTVTFTPAPYTKEPFTAAQITATAGQIVNATITYAPSTNLGNQGGEVSLASATGPMCANVTPPKVVVQGTGTGYDNGTAVFASGNATLGFGASTYGWVWGQPSSQNFQTLPDELKGALGAAADEQGDMCVVRSDKTVKCYGPIFNGGIGVVVQNLGNNTKLQNVTSISEQLNQQCTNYACGQLCGGAGHLWCATESDGSVWCWRENDMSSLGKITNLSGASSVTVQAIDASATYAIGTYYPFCCPGGFWWTCGCQPACGPGVTAHASPAAVCVTSQTDGTVSCGQMQNFSTTLANSAALSPTVKASAISGGYAHTCAADTSGAVTCWGKNNNGQLGDGTMNDSFPPDTWNLPNNAQATGIAVGTWHSCALDKSGNVYCWGANYNGQLGVGNTAQSSSPVQIANFTAKSMTSGFNHVCAQNGNQLYCWGDDSWGQIAPLSLIGGGSKLAPLAVPFLSTH